MEIKIQKMNKIIQLFAICILTSCQTEPAKINSYFNEHKQKGIIELISFFKNEICNSNYSDEVFKTEINKIKESFINGDATYTGLNIKDISEFTEELNSKYKLNIFTKECSTHTLDREKTIKYFCISSKSNFRNYLNKNKSLKKSWTNLNNELTAIGVLSSNSIRYLLTDEDGINTNSVDEMLVLAVTIMQNEFQKNAEKQLKN